MLNKNKILMLLIVISLNGCVRTVVSMSSTPSNALVIINKGINQKTPFIVSYSNAGGKLVHFSLNKDGYKEVTGFITKDGEVYQDNEGMIVSKEGNYHFNLEVEAK